MSSGWKGNAAHRKTAGQNDKTWLSLKLLRQALPALLRKLRQAFLKTLLGAFLVFVKNQRVGWATSLSLGGHALLLTPHRLCRLQCSSAIACPRKQAWDYLPLTHEVQHSNFTRLPNFPLPLPLPSNFLPVPIFKLERGEVGPGAAQDHQFHFGSSLLPCL